MVVRKVISIGNTTAITLPERVLRQYMILPGDLVLVRFTSEGILISPFPLKERGGQYSLGKRDPREVNALGSFIYRKNPPEMEGEEEE